MAPSRLEQRGVRAIVTTRGAGMRWPFGSRETNAAWPDVKSCGPGTPTLVPSRQMILPATVANKPGHRGDHDISAKTAAQGMPDVRLILW
jgi:hypothetical protein